MINNSYNVHKLYIQELKEIAQQQNIELFELPQDAAVKASQIQQQTLLDADGGKLLDGLKQIVKSLLEE